MQIEVTRNLPVPLTDAEVADRVHEAKRRADATAELTLKIAKLAEAAKAAKEDRETEYREIKRLVKIADAREEERPVKCRWTYDLAAGAATLVRIDSGEMVESRAMTSKEREEVEQRPLFGDREDITITILPDEDEAQ